MTSTPIQRVFPASQLLALKETIGTLLSKHAIECRKSKPKYPRILLPDLPYLPYLQYENKQRCVSRGFSRDINHAPSNFHQTHRPHVWSQPPGRVSTRTHPSGASLFPLVNFPRPPLPMEGAPVWNVLGPVAFYPYFQAHHEVPTHSRDCVTVKYR